jgi:MFS family permease
VPRFIWIYAVGMLAFTSLTGVLALFLKDEHGVTQRTIGYFFAYVGVLSVLMRSLLLGPIVDRVGEVRAMRLGAGLLIVGLALYPLAGSIGQLAAVIPLVPIGTALLFPSTTSLMSHFSPKAEVGTTMGVAQTFAGISRVAAPLMATVLYQRLGHGVPFYVAAGIVALVSLLAFRVEHPAARAAVPPAGAEESA